MTDEERWERAFADEEQEPSDWIPDLAALEVRLREHLAKRGCEWPEIAATVVAARAFGRLDRRAFAFRIGLAEPSLRALEGATLGGKGGHSVNDELLRHFQREALDGVETLKKDIGYNPTIFLRMVSDQGAVEATKRLLRTRDASDGFTTLWEFGRLAMSVEAMAVLPWYEPLFSAEEIRIARTRLELHGFDVDGYLGARRATAPSWVSSH